MLDRRLFILGAAALSSLLGSSAAFAMVDGGDAGADTAAVGRVLVSGQDGLLVRGCTGTLVDRQWMVTAGRCVAAGEPTKVTIGGTTVAVTGVVTHPVRDVAILKLAGPVTAVAPAALGAHQGDTTSGQLYHHLRALQGAGLIVQRRRGEYDLSPQAVVPVLAILAAAMNVATDPPFGAPPSA